MISIRDISLAWIRPPCFCFRFENAFFRWAGGLEVDITSLQLSSRQSHWNTGKNYSVLSNSIEVADVRISSCVNKRSNAGVFKYADKLLQRLDE